MRGSVLADSCRHGRQLGCQVIGTPIRELSIKAIILGGVSDVALSALLGIPFTMYVLTSRGLTGLPQEQVQGAVLAAIHGGSLLYGVQIGIGCACSMAGGYIAASIAKYRRLLNGVLASWLCLGIGIYSMISGHVASSLWVHLGLLVLTPICYALGARIKLKTMTPPALAIQ